MREQKIIEKLKKTISSVSQIFDLQKYDPNTRKTTSQRIGEGFDHIERTRRARKGRVKGGKATPEQEADRLSVETTDKRSDDSKRDIRTAVAQEFNVPENKLRGCKSMRKRLAKKLTKGLSQSRLWKPEAET